MRRLASVLALAVISCGREPSPVVLERLDAIDNRLRELEPRMARLEQADRERAQASSPASGVPLELEAPRATAGGKLETRASIAIAKDGIRLNGDVVGPAELSERLAAIHRKDPAIGLIVRADADVPYSKVVEILDLARSVGIDRFSVAAFASPGEPPGPPEEPPPIRAK